ncbi:hypothetical protein OH491_08310 [Termitidicoccus mucosus]|uniref:hypothetical protein n=1 Tax=Termitidicoccus mucosus TaxID=1184151 RepID=UPI0031838709
MLISLGLIILIGVLAKLIFDINSIKTAMPGLIGARDQALRDLKLSRNEGFKLQKNLRQSKLLLQSIEDNLNKLNQGTAVVEDNMEQIEDALDS